MADVQPSELDRYPAALERARTRWQDGDLWPVVQAVAEVTGVDEQALDWHVEAVRGWEAHDAGYEAAVWESSVILRQQKQKQKTETKDG